MDASSPVFRFPVLCLVSPILAAVLTTPGECVAGGSAPCSPSYCLFVDGGTHCAWHRTWHGPDVLATPLRGYYIPRTPACCGGSGFPVQYREMIGDFYLPPGEWEGGLQPAADCCPACRALEPGGMERLGQVPNDIELSVGMPGGGPDRAGR